MFDVCNPNAIRANIWRNAVMVPVPVPVCSCASELRVAIQFNYLFFSLGAYFFELVHPKQTTTVWAGTLLVLVHIAHGYMTCIPLCRMDWQWIVDELKKNKVWTKIGRPRTITNCRHGQFFYPISVPTIVWGVYYDWCDDPVYVLAPRILLAHCVLRPRLLPSVTPFRSSSF